MRDASHAGCIKVLNVSLAVTQPSMLNAIVTFTMVTCNGADDGTITISSPTGGYGTYEYTIDAGGSWQLAGTFTSLAPATYNVRIRDASHTGCTVVLNPQLTITEPAPLTRSCCINKCDMQRLCRRDHQYFLPGRRVRDL